MSAAKIAAALGGARREGRNWRCRCPRHGGHSFVLANGRDSGLLVKCWAGCDPREIFAELRWRGLLGNRAEPSPGAPPSRPVAGGDDVRRIERARSLWNAARDARDSPVAAYLASRGITVPPPPCLRWAPACPHPSGLHLPAMIAVIVNVDSELIGIHRTFLRPNGSAKAEIRPAKAMLGRAVGGAVRLAPAAVTLMIGEGLETCLAAMPATGMPAWAALSTSGMVALILPPIVRTAIILADHDRTGAGERAARTAAQRWLAEGRRVRIAMPIEPGTDFADVLAGRACTEIRDVAA